MKNDNPWYFEDLAKLTNEKEFRVFFEKNYFIDNRSDIKMHWCGGHMSLVSKEKLYNLVKIVWRASLKIGIIKDLKK